MGWCEECKEDFEVLERSSWELRSCGNFLYVSGSIVENKGTNLPRNVLVLLPTDAASYPRRMESSL